MKHFFSALLLLVLFTSALLSGCKKDEAAAPTTGSLSGTVSPAGSITQVTAKNGGGNTFPATPDAASGAFSITGLAAGSYTLSFTTATGYKMVADRTISIVAGQNTAAGTVQATSDGTIKSGTMSWTVNGQTYTTTSLTGKIDRATNGSFYLTGRSTSGNQIDEVSLGTTYLFNGVGTYDFRNSFSSASYKRTTGGITTFEYLCGGNSSGTGNGNLIVTQYDETAGTAVGTFGFVGTSGTSSATISNGTFSLKF